MSAQPRKILVGYDGTDSSVRALDRAIQLTGYGSTLTVVNVTNDGEPPGAVLDDARRRVRSRLLTASYVQRVGEAAEQLLEAANDIGAELVVVGRRTASTVPEPGTVSAAVVRRSPCDVLVVG
jgi:nucleotide-binding universal stress UspA family protein